MLMIDDLTHKGQRNNLVENLRKRGIKDEKVLSAILKVPRHLFFSNPGLSQNAYEDRAYPILAGQTISQPFTVAFQTELLEIKKYDKVLEIGTGSGYQSSVLCEMGAKVYSIERQKELFLFTQKLLNELCFHINVFYGDGHKGLPQFAPFDKILVTAAAERVPELLINQLKIGGFLVVPCGDSSGQIMKKITRVSETEISEKEYGQFSFVPMLKGTE